MLMDLSPIQSNTTVGHENLLVVVLEIDLVDVVQEAAVNFKVIDDYESIFCSRCRGF